MQHPSSLEVNPDAEQVFGVVDRGVTICISVIDIYIPPD
jgi:hypothetical protein